MLQFAVSGLVATVLIGLVAVALIRRTGTAEAIRDAKQVTRLAGEGIVEPGVNRAVLAGDPGAVARLDRVVRSRVLRDGIVRVKLWTAAGRVVYSDEPRLIGTSYPLGADERRTIEQGRVEAEVSDLSRPENRFERSEDKLLEVYLPVRGPGGQRLLFEAYQRFSSVSASGRRLWLAFAPALLGGLLVLQLVNLPLARSMVRRLSAAQSQRETLLRRAIDSSQHERRRIAADLHDGVVQDLVGVSFELESQAKRLDGDGNSPPAVALRRGAGRARDSVRALRALLVDIYPPSLHRAGLRAALGDLMTTIDSRGVETTMTFPDDVELPPATEALLFRSALETLRNTVAHAEAARVDVTISVAGAMATLVVADNGRGFDAGVLEHRPTEGHFGLRLVRDLVEDAGGRFRLETAPGSGTMVTVEVPVA